MAIKVIKTTDKRFEGLVLPFNSINEVPQRLEVLPGVFFVTLKKENLGGNKWRVSNYNYVVDVEVN